MKCTCKNKEIIGTAYADDNRSFGIIIRVDDEEIDEFIIQDLVDENCTDMEEEFDIRIVKKEYEVRCCRCGKIVEI